MGEEVTEGVLEKKKAHRTPKSGRKAEKKKAKNKHVQELTDRQRNPKAFALKSPLQAERRFRRKQDLETKKTHIPLVDRNPVEPPPVVVAVVGPPKVGKTTVIENLIKHFTKQRLAVIKGPVTVVTGKKQRITIIECNNDINCMIDLAKVADLVLLLVDASFGFEMEVFEFLNICQIHGMPRVLGVLTHLDLLKNNKQLKKTKKTLKHRFWTEVYAGAKLFYLSGMMHGEYLKNDIRNLGRFISVIKLRPLIWRTTHPYVLVDRLEDITDPEQIRQDSKCDRNICLYGFVRGIALNKENRIHIPGCGDTKITNVSFLPDPCPLPEKKKRSLIEREKIIYAPFSGVGGIVYDKDAVYFELAGSHSFEESKPEEEKELVNSLLTTQDGMDIKRDKSMLKIFSHSKPIISNEYNDGNFTTKDLLKDELDKESSDEGGEENDENGGNEESGSYLEEKVEEDGRIRRRVVFKNDINISGREKDADGDDDDDEDEDEDDDDDDDEKDDESDDNEMGFTSQSENQIKAKIENALKNVKSKRNYKSESSGIESDEHEFEEDTTDMEDYIDEIHKTKKRKSNLVEEDDSKKARFEEGDDFEESAAKWKESLVQRASDAFLQRQSNTQNLFKLVYGTAKRMLDVGREETEKQDKEEIGGIFHFVSEKQRQKVAEKDHLNEYDCSIFFPPVVRDWTSVDVKILIKDCFVTGRWRKTEDAEQLLKLDDLSENEYGDFEDLETGEKQETKKEEKEAEKDFVEKKKKLKERFDAEYDEKEESSYYSDLKAQVDQQAQLNKSVYEGLPDDLRVQLEGYRPGMYVRVELSNMPCELVEHFDPTYPLIIGGLLPIEENIGFIQVRLKKHRWYGKILKTKDPLIVSLGWRRFQTLPIFSKLEDNMRQRMLKYTPEHVACMAHFFGPITPQGSGLVAVQDVAARTPGFRIACTGSVVEADKSTTITKKLKLVGTPSKIFKKTAFIQGMFNSVLEVGKFEGAKIRTVSGIRGQIKKAISKPPGAFRATFEDRIKLSDIVFCRTWYAVEVPKFYNPVTTLLLSPEKKAEWKGMKTLGQLKRENNLKNQVNPDSLYTPIKRKPKTFKPLKIPVDLQKALPYKDKPKIPAQSKKIQRVAVVREPYEEKVASLMKMLKTNFKQKKYLEKKAMIDRVKKHKEMKRAIEMRKLKRQKELKKQIFRTLSKTEKRQSKK